ncbi:carbonic anhydrase [Crossiella equi]|uniref:carbonic anhydrase n=1 Tax=Crossiella equi TaxID=130796 RepID=A0ABS5AQ64_9PSEU|nr:carbonic anhydrase family protein [Crossiella equi]MBP2478359.1 carbonic anhydrase [Crossiella equi]
MAQSQVPLQSPINITPDAIRIDPSHPKLDVNYGSAPLELRYVRKDADAANGCATRHHEETEEAEVPAGAGHVIAAGVRYDLIQFHFHTPSEHTFLGHHLPLEMHLVHRSAAGKLLVVGVPLRAGAHSAVDEVLAKLSPECGDTVDVHSLDLNRLLPANRHMLRYQGSLTTAPFSGDVQWYVASEFHVSQATISRFQHLFTAGNARSTQPLNGRTLTEVGRI